MTETTLESNKAGYLSAWEKLRSDGAPEWVRAIRDRGAQRFGDLDLPHNRMEAWRQTNVSPITGGSFVHAAGEPGQPVTTETLTPHLYAGLKYTAVFVNGVFTPSLSSLDGLPDGVRVASLADAALGDDPAVQAHLDAYASKSTDAYTALNAAFLTDGCFIHIGKGVALQEAIHVVFVANGEGEPAVQYPRLLAVADENSEATVIESYAGLTSDQVYFNDAVAEYVLGANAHIRSYKLLRESAAAFHLATQHIQQDRDSTYKSYVFNLGGRIARNELNVMLDGPGAGCSLHGLYLGEKDQLIDNHQSITHAKPNCTSWIGYKGVLDGDTKAAYTGKIYVDRIAQKTDSNQLNQNLLLSDDAQIDTKPQLEIYADDVKCTHGATIGQFGPELINYFRSRGIAPDMAKAMLTYGFADEVVREVEVEPLRSFLETYVFDRYSP